MNVKALREKKGITQEELAEKTNIPRGRIAKWEQGKGSPKVEDAEKLAAFFAEPIEEVRKNGEQVTAHENKVKDEPETPPTSQLLETIQLLVKQQDKLISSYDKIADANRILAQKVDTIPVNAQQESQITFDAIIGGLQELLVDLGTGTHWNSRDQGAAAVRNKLYASLREKSVGRTQKR